MELSLIDLLPEIMNLYIHNSDLIRSMSEGDIHNLFYYVDMNSILPVNNVITTTNTMNINIFNQKYQTYRIKKSKKQCYICLESFIPDTSLVKVLKCKHIFCVNCISKWVTSYKNECPICKLVID